MWINYTYFDPVDHGMHTCINNKYVSHFCNLSFCCLPYIMSHQLSCWSGQKQMSQIYLNWWFDFTQPLNCLKNMLYLNDKWTRMVSQQQLMGTRDVYIMRFIYIPFTNQALPTGRPCARWYSCCRLARTSRCCSDFRSISFNNVSYRLLHRKDRLSLPWMKRYYWC